MSQARIILGILIILLGISFFTDFPLFRIAIALFVIWIGIRILTGVDIGEAKNQIETQEERINRVLIFSGINRKYTTKNFKGGEVVAVFGGGEIDLTEAKAEASNVPLEVVAVFGGLKVKVPQSWSVKTEGIGILGGFDDKTKLEGKKAADVIVKGVAIFGGVEITN
jgi:predicted membrane protein